MGAEERSGNAGARHPGSSSSTVTPSTSSTAGVKLTSLPARRRSSAASSGGGIDGAPSESGQHLPTTTPVKHRLPLARLPGHAPAGGNSAAKAKPGGGAAKAKASAHDWADGDEPSPAAVPVAFQYRRQLLVRHVVGSESDADADSDRESLFFWRRGDNEAESPLLRVRPRAVATAALQSAVDGEAGDAGDAAGGGSAVEHASPGGIAGDDLDSAGLHIDAGVPMHLNDTVGSDDYGDDEAEFDALSPDAAVAS